MRQQPFRISLYMCALLFASIALIGCGGKQNAPANMGTTAPMGGAQGTMHTPLAEQAPIPSSLHCKGDIVWANPARKIYHEPSDPYYGRTRHGEYMCRAAAEAAGYHKAGSRRKNSGTMMQQATPEPAYT